jgi:hypothetical protein
MPTLFPAAFPLACLVSVAVTATAAARSPGCGARAVVAQDGTVLYWTGATRCGAEDATRDPEGGSDWQDFAPVARSRTDPGPAEPRPEPVPETRPVQGEVGVLG